MKKIIKSILVMGLIIVIDVRMNSSIGSGSWLRNVMDGTQAVLPGDSIEVYKC